MARLTVLYDNAALSSYLLASHGFSCLVEEKERVLFDTGESGPLLFKNMELLGIDPCSISSVVISHEHYDHIGGLWHFLSCNPKVTVYILPSFSEETKERIWKMGAKVVEAENPRQITDSVSTTGEVQGPVPEQGLFVAGRRGVLLLGGCCHPGPVAMLERAQSLGKRVSGFLGGLHLSFAREEEIEKTLKTMKAQGVEVIAPTHCTGFFAIELARSLWADGYIPCGVGTQLSW
ncbi:MAG: MBL fold metallo-hydrolase [Candidatus Caldatribacterium sp.]|nr:MBL fold metallo-hydrolase [Candidatus Caldatribacterium sp.]